MQLNCVKIFTHILSGNRPMYKSDNQ